MSELNQAAEMKLKAARMLTRWLRMRQIHIIGCARSGTNLVHFAMLAFAGVRVAEQESKPDYPSLGVVLGMLRRGEIGRERTMLVTKRGYHWTEPASLEILLRRIRHEHLRLIHVVRDPRDVLVSTHASTRHGRAYVSVERWADSVRAGRVLMEACTHRDSALTLRYEDLVSDPVCVLQRIGVYFGLHLREDIPDLADLASLISTSNHDIALNRIRSMHRLRPIDPHSVGRWRADPEVPDVFARHPLHRAELESFMRAHGYEW